MERVINMERSGYSPDHGDLGEPPNGGSGLDVERQKSCEYCPFLEICLRVDVYWDSPTCHMMINNAKLMCPCCGQPSVFLVYRAIGDNEEHLDRIFDSSLKAQHYCEEQAFQAGEHGTELRIRWQVLKVE